MGLGLAMVEKPDDKTDPSYSVVIVITADGDLDRAFHSCPHEVYVCGLKASLSSSLERFVKVTPEGRRLYLDGIVRAAYGGGSEGGDEDAVSDADSDDVSTASSVSSGGTRRLTKCFAGSICDKLLKWIDSSEWDEEHMTRYRHPCEQGEECAFLYNEDSEERRRHLMLFGHTCRLRHHCKGGDVHHKRLCEHPKPGKPVCPDPDCKQVWDRAHAKLYRHRCPDDKKCALMKRVSTDPAKLKHMRHYMHSCSFGKACLYAKDPYWNWEHMLQFMHPRRCVEATGGAGASSGGARGATRGQSSGELKTTGEMKEGVEAAEASQQPCGGAEPLMGGSAVPRPYVPNVRPPEATWSDRDNKPAATLATTTDGQAPPAVMAMPPRTVHAVECVSSAARPVEEQQEEEDKKQAAVLEQQEEQQQQQATVAAQSATVAKQAVERTFRRKPLGEELASCGPSACRHEGCGGARAAAPDHLCVEHGGGRCQAELSEGQWCGKAWEHKTPRGLYLCKDHIAWVPEEEVAEWVREQYKRELEKELKESGCKNYSALPQSVKRGFSRQFLLFTKKKAGR